MIVSPETENSELSPPTEADVSLPEESTATASVNDDGADVVVLTTESWLDEVVVCADSNVVTPLRFEVSTVDSVPVSSCSSLFELNDRPRSAIDMLPTVLLSACSSWVMTSRMVESPNRIALEEAGPSELVADWAITSSRNVL